MTAKKDSDVPDALAGSQTLSRGLTALALIGESRRPMTINELSVELGVNRSSAYRIVRTLEQHRFVQRAENGELHLGLRLAAFGRGGARDLSAAAQPELQRVADELAMTAFLVVFDGDEVITLLSVEPARAATFVSQRPGRRQPVGRGAPGRVIRSQLAPAQHPPARYEMTSEEVLAGITAIAVPLRADQPASIAVLFPTGEIEPDAIVAELERASERIASGGRVESSVD
ncbi:MAG: helix-turn-helix domain-containing protein [Actinobacteria bacterium]|nr:helix-turn-helix domain-containing protein [Actinomycetota bacterium]